MAKYGIQQFFAMTFEQESTSLLINNPSFFSKEVVIDYLVDMAKIPLQDYIDYLIKNPILKEISSKDITQLSSIEDCTVKMCRVLKESNNRGLSFSEIAVALHGENNYKDTKVALLKYGENQVKTAAQLGLATCFNDLWYASAIGYTFEGIYIDVRNKYLSTSLLRDPYYSRVIISLLTQDTNICDYMKILSESTKKRRFSSCRRVLSFFIGQCEKENIKIHNIKNN